ncbi:MAG: portal protein [Herbinix sp.]|nr:portal protein [Herbinix sp.]
MGIITQNANVLKARAEPEERADGMVEFESTLLQALIGKTTITKTEALSIPSVQGCIKFAADTVSMLPIKLYRDNNGKVEEIKNDRRVRLLNDDPGDTLDSVQFWRALITDYYLGKGGYAYIKRDFGGFESLHYVDEINISQIKNTDPIFKDYDIMVQGKPYKPYEFIKLLRNTKDGCRGTSIVEENALFLSVVYNSLIFEENLVKKGGNRKGFLKSENKLDDPAMTSLREAYARLYSNNSENVVVLNKGIEFQEASNSSVEMQLNENKDSNSTEVCKIFLFPLNVITGTATEKEYTNAFKLGVMPLLKVAECALNRDFLLESEKDEYYWAFDTKEMLKGSIKERYEAYGIAIERGFMKIDEARYMEDKEPFGIDWINVGLNSVLYNTKTGEVYTPNTDKVNDTTKLKGGEEDASGDQG